MRAPVAIALDVSTLPQAIAHTKSLGSHVAMMKVGLQSYLRDGNAGISEIKEHLQGAELFLDLKLHDIPATVAGAVKSIKTLDPNVLTVHAAGGFEMLKSAVEQAEHIDIAAVTILTSLSQSDVSVFSDFSIDDLVVRLADLAVRAGCRAIVCSPHEVAAVRNVVGNDVRLIVPGVRMPGDDAGDQIRIATPATAIANGADLVVMGRSILGNIDPIQQVAEVAESIKAAQ
jgi:orotidine-5'-phosphate decarboxylase